MGHKVKNHCYILFLIGIVFIAVSTFLCGGVQSQQRLGLGCVEGDREQSPMLLQLMECVYNVWLQHPYAFEVRAIRRSTMIVAHLA